jgi:meiotically up-regulated gene 157 (Mug157) protein
MQHIARFNFSVLPLFQLFFDDANSPSLLSLPYIGWIEHDNSLYRATRNFILGDGNPFFFRGSAGQGIGSPHVPWRFVWPMSIIMQALTSSSDHEISECLTTLRDTTAGRHPPPDSGLLVLITYVYARCDVFAGTGFMHESFNINNASDFTRPWFAWANTLFGDLILKLSRERPWLIFDEIHEN